MADEKDDGYGRVGPFLLGKQYEEVDSSLGRLHEAWLRETGQPSLVFFPAKNVEWQPEGRWQTRLICQPGLPYVGMVLDESPDSAQVSELTDFMELMTGAVKRVEDSPQAQAHLARRPLHRRPSWASTALVAGGFLLVGMGLGWSLARERGQAERVSMRVTFERPSQFDAPDWTNREDSSTGPIVYPLPYEPFRNQAKAPCRLDLAEVEINGGCWVVLEQRPPCAVNRAEYQGKCYLPVGKDKDRPPQSSQP